MDASALDARSPALRAARAAVAQARTATIVSHYSQIAGQLPMLLHRHGLGQLLAYLKAQGDDRDRSPYTVLARQLDGWLLETMGVSAKDALSALAKRDSGFYREAAEQARLFLVALRTLLEHKP